MIKIINLSKKYGKTLVLDNISIDIPTNKILGLIGENGAGKTTFFKTLLNICSVDGGMIENNSKFRKVVFDLSPNLRGFSVLEYIRYYSLLYSENRIFRKDYEIDKILTKINLLPVKKKKVSELSFGMKKMLYISTLLIGKTDLAVIDEPFNGLDEKSRGIVKDIIYSLKKSYNATIIISSHQHEQLYDICDSIFNLENGKLKQINILNNYVMEIQIRTYEDFLAIYYKYYNKGGNEAEFINFLGNYFLNNPQNIYFKFKEKKMKYNDELF